MLIFYSILLGISMKWADLLNEHGIKSFHEVKIYMGIIWGLTMLIICGYSDAIFLAWLGIMASYVIRGCIDYLNHVIAAIIFFVFAIIAICIKEYSYILTFVFFMVSILLDMFLKLKQYNALFAFICFSIPLYCLTPFVFYYNSLYGCDFDFFASFTSFALSYNTIRLKYYYLH